MLYGCRARGVFRKRKITPLVGDQVIVDTSNNIIVKVLPRKNELKRPAIANVDIALIITSVKEPNLDLVLLDPPYKMIVINEVIDYLLINSLLNESSLIVCEMDDNVEYHNKLEVYKERDYGSKKVIIYRV